MHRLRPQDRQSEPILGRGAALFSRTATQLTPPWTGLTLKARWRFGDQAAAQVRHGAGAHAQQAR
eukprot:1234023-Prymnesium_polylepis.1